IPGARVVLDQPSGEPLVTYTNARGLYVLPPLDVAGPDAAKGGLTAGPQPKQPALRLTVAAPQYRTQLLVMEIPGLGAQVDVRLVRERVPATGEPVRHRVMSSESISGAGRNWSGWYRLCSQALPSNEIITGPVVFSLVGDRTCGSWAECREALKGPS